LGFSLLAKLRGCHTRELLERHSRKGAFRDFVSKKIAAALGDPFIRSGEPFLVLVRQVALSHHVQKRLGVIDQIRFLCAQLILSKMEVQGFRVAGVYLFRGGDRHTFDHQRNIGGNQVSEDLRLENKTGTCKAERPPQQNAVVIQVKQLVDHNDPGLIRTVTGEHVGAQTQRVWKSNVVIDRADRAVKSEQADAYIDVPLLLVVWKAVLETQQALEDAFSRRLIKLLDRPDAAGEQVEEPVDHGKPHVLVGVSEDGAIEEIAILALDGLFPEQALFGEALARGLFVEGNHIVEHVDYAVIVQKDFIGCGGPLF